MRLPAAAPALLGLIYLAFISLGLPDGSFGVAWPRMHADVGLPLGFAGALTTSVTLLAGLSGFLSGRILARWGTGPVVAGSCALTALALLLAAGARDLAWVIAAGAGLGCGAGAVDAGLNGYVARHYTARHMNWLHACWGIGATAGPVVMGWAIARGHGWRAAYLALGGVQLALAAVLWASLRLWDAVPAHDPVGRGRSTDVAAGADVHSATGWISPGVMFIYTALELTAGLWAASVLIVARGFTPGEAAFATAAYYGAITGGRVLAGWLAGEQPPGPLLAGATALALGGALAFAWAPAAWVATPALLLLGLGFAPVYPTLMHAVPARFRPEDAATVIGRQTGAAYLGAALVPAAAGALVRDHLPLLPWALAGGVALLGTGLALLEARTACQTRPGAATLAPAKPPLPRP